MDCQLEAKHNELLARCKDENEEKQRKLDQLQEDLQSIRNSLKKTQADLNESRMREKRTKSLLQMAELRNSFLETQQRKSDCVISELVVRALQSNADLKTALKVLLHTGDEPRNLELSVKLSDRAETILENMKEITRSDEVSDPAEDPIAADHSKDGCLEMSGDDPLRTEIAEPEVTMKKEAVNESLIDLVGDDSETEDIDVLPCKEIIMMEDINPDENEGYFQDNETDALASDDCLQSANIQRVDDSAEQEFSTFPAPKKVCSNCRARKSAGWYKVADTYRCNACGIYFRRTGEERPYNLWCRNKTEKGRMRKLKVCRNCGTRETGLWHKFGDHNYRCNACGQYLKRTGEERSGNLLIRSKLLAERMKIYYPNVKPV